MVGTARADTGPEQQPHLDLAMSVFIRSTFFCFSFISSGLRGASGSSSMYRSGMSTLSGVESWVEAKAGAETWDSG